MSHAEQIIVERASEIIESRQEPDRYSFLFHGRKLVSPFTGKPVENSMEDVSLIGQREFAAFNQVQNWAVDSPEGLAFWLSPPHELRTGQTKLVVYEISELDGQKSLLNRMLLFDINYSDSLRIANEIARAFGNTSHFTDSEEVRSNTIFSSFNMKQDVWLGIITKIINNPRQWSMLENGEDIAIAQRTIEWVLAGKSEQNMGSNPGSCPPGLASDVLSRHSQILEGKFVKNCGKCGKTINKTILKGYQCECGGVYEGC